MRPHPPPPWAANPSATPTTSFSQWASLWRTPWHILTPETLSHIYWLFLMHFPSADEFLMPLWLCCRITSPSAPLGISLAPACWFLCCCMLSPQILMITDSLLVFFLITDILLLLFFFFLVEEPWMRENQIISAAQELATDLKWFFACDFLCSGSGWWVEAAFLCPWLGNLQLGLCASGSSEAKEIWLAWSSLRRWALLSCFQFLRNYCHGGGCRNRKHFIFLSHKLYIRVCTHLQYYKCMCI